MEDGKSVTLFRNSFSITEIVSRYLCNLKLTNRNRRLGYSQLADLVRKRLSIYKFSPGLPNRSLMCIETILKLMQMPIPLRCSKIWVATKLKKSSNRTPQQTVKLQGQFFNRLVSLWLHPVYWSKIHYLMTSKLLIQENQIKISSYQTCPYLTLTVV